MPHSAMVRAKAAVAAAWRLRGVFGLVVGASRLSLGLLRGRRLSCPLNHQGGDPVPLVVRLDGVANIVVRSALSLENQPTELHLADGRVRSKLPPGREALRRDHHRSVRRDGPQQVALLHRPAG
eukprot:scaffold5496_cov112-Isochrysis_galbana.AAC.1